MKTLDEERRRIRRSLVFTWATMLTAGIAGGHVYCLVSLSPERIFHALIIFAFLGVTLPLMSTLTRLSLRAYFLGYESMERQTRVLEALEKAAGEDKLEATLAAVRQLPEKLDRLAAGGPDLMGRL